MIAPRLLIMHIRHPVKLAQSTNLLYQFIIAICEHDIQTRKWNNKQAGVVT